MSKLLEKERREKKEKIKTLIVRLLQEIEEEDISISLFTLHYQDEEELRFFSAADRQRVFEILARVSEDSVRHKEIIKKIVDFLEERACEY